MRANGKPIVDIKGGDLKKLMNFRGVPQSTGFLDIDFTELKYLGSGSCCTPYVRMRSLGDADSPGHMAIKLRNGFFCLEISL